MTDWYQQALTPPLVLECNVRVGVIPSEDHAQALVELKDPTTGVLIGQWSRAHVPLRNMAGLIAWATSKAQQALEDHAEPF